MVAGLEERLFEGENGKGKIPKYSISDLDKGLFRFVESKFYYSNLAILSSWLNFFPPELQGKCLLQVSPREDQPLNFWRSGASVFWQLVH